MRRGEQSKLLIYLLAAVFFDCFIMSIWFLSGLLLMRGVYLLIKGRKVYEVKVKALALIAIFVFTTLVGYISASAVEYSFVRFANSQNESFPQTKEELMVRAKFPWPVRVAIVNYVSNQQHTVATLRLFPAMVAYYDFESKQLNKRPY